MKKIFTLVTLFTLFFFSNSNSDDKINKLKNLFEKGLITQEELKQALELVDNSNSKIKVEQISGTTGREKFEKYEFYIDNFRVYTLNPGTIRIDNMLTGETDVTLSGNFKIKISKNGKKFFKFDYDENSLKSNLFYKGKPIINWTAKYVPHHQATFHQMQVDGTQPFHYFIVIPGKNNISINFKLFERKIEKAVNKVKEEMSAKYNLSLADIDRIIEKKNSAISKEQEKLIKELTEKYAGKEINEQIRAEIEKTVGEEMANVLISQIEQLTGEAIDSAIENELANAIDDAISNAIQEGVSEATAIAAIEAMILVYALGGSDEDAMDACRSIAGDAC